MRIRLFGGVAAIDDRGEPVDVGPAKSQALLAALALSPGRPVPAWRLVELVWGEAPPRTAERTLQSYVTRLRKALGAGAIVRSGVAYRLDVPADAVDVARFERLLDAGEVDAALAEWTATPLAEVDAPGLAPAVDALVERWLGATEAALEHRVAHDPAAAIGTLTELTAAHPFREGLWALLMTALYRVDRQADALAAFRTARERLVDDLGIEPGSRLRALEARILAQEEMPAAAAAEPQPAEAGSAAPPAPGGEEERPRGNLPRALGRLIGRERELAAIAAALAADPVVTLAGPGGIGKTRLALAAAGHADGEAWLIELAEIADDADVPRAAADALGVAERAGRTPTEALATALRTRRALLVLDNCEHVIEGAAALARAIAERCRDVRVLATSREALGIGGERRIEVAPLEPAGAAAELFGERAAAAGATFDAHASRREVEEICRRLDGIPLAIELAAARVRTLAPAELLERLDGRLRLLRGGRRTASDRHRTLEATIRWSYDLLAPAERALFDRLSVFAGSFDLAAAEAVAGDADAGAEQTDALLGDLVERSMVVAEPGRRGRRFRLLETMRAFAAERLRDAGQAEAVAARHARRCLDEADRVGALLAGPEEIEGVARLDELWPELRAAFEWACAAGDRELARALMRPVAAEVLLRSRQEIGDWAQRLLAIAPAGDADTILFALAWYAQRCAVAHDPGAYERLVLVGGSGALDDPVAHHARACAREDWAAMAEWAPRAAAAHRRRGEDVLAEQAEIDAGAALLNLGRLEQHDAVVGPLAERYRVHGPPTLRNWTLMLLGYSATFQGDRERAERLFEEAVAVELPPRTHSPNRPIEARIAFRHGDRPRAFRILRAHVEDLLATDNMQGASIAAVELASMLVALDRLGDAALVLAYVETTGLLDAPPFRALVEDAAAKVAAAGAGRGAEEEAAGFDDRRALERMREILDGLLEPA